MPKSHRFIDITGHVFDRLTVVEFLGTRNGSTYWRCLCECGKQSDVSSANLRRVHTRSCGCLKIENAGKQKITHAMSGSRIYIIWRAMRDRCKNTNVKQFDDYGGRGIKVCQEWDESFECFLLDMGEPAPGLTLDRRDNNKGYSKSNCRWATRKQQANNRRSNRHIDVRGEKMTINQAAETLHMHRSTIYERLKRGLTGDSLVASTGR